MVIKAGDVELPAPVSLKVDDEIIWSVSTGRALDGTMLGDVVAEKKNISIQWGLMPETDCKLIKDSLISGFFPITISCGSNNITISVYRSTLSREFLGELDDGCWYRSVSVQIIEQ